MSSVLKILKTAGIYLVILVIFLGAIGFGAFQRYRFRDHETELKNLFNRELDIIRKQVSVHEFPALSPWRSRAHSVDHFFTSLIINGNSAQEILKILPDLPHYFPYQNSYRNDLMDSFRLDLVILDLEEREVQGRVWADSEEVSLSFARRHISRAEGWVRSGRPQYALINLLAALRLSKAAIGKYSGSDRIVEAYFIGGRAIDLLFGRRLIIREVLNLGTRSVWSVQAGKIYQGYFQK